MRFSEKLNILLMRKGIKGKQVAEVIGVTDACVSRWRQGQTYPRCIELYKLAHMLGVTMEWLIKEDV